MIEEAILNLKQANMNMILVICLLSFVVLVKIAGIIGEYGCKKKEERNS